jgi:hypothetical protein
MCWPCESAGGGGGGRLRHPRRGRCQALQGRRGSVRPGTGAQVRGSDGNPRDSEDAESFRRSNARGVAPWGDCTLRRKSWRTPPLRFGLRCARKGRDGQGRHSVRTKWRLRWAVSVETPGGERVTGVVGCDVERRTLRRSRRESMARSPGAPEQKPSAPRSACGSPSLPKTRNGTRRSEVPGVAPWGDCTLRRKSWRTPPLRCGLRCARKGRDGQGRHLLRRAGDGVRRYGDRKRRRGRHGSGYLRIIKA